MAVSASQSVQVSSNTFDSSAPTSVVIKNTFICLSSEEPLPCSFRRCSSAPPTPRGGESSKNADNFGMSPSTSLPSNLPSLKSWPAFSKEQDAGSTSSTLAQDGTSSENGTDICSYDISETASVTSSREGMTISLVDLLPAKALPPRASLSTKAKAWAPVCQPIGGSAGLPPEVHLRFANVMKAGQTALKACMQIKNADVQDTASSWSLTGSLQPEASHQAGSILALAQKAFLHAAEKSDNVYIIGYETQPFKAIAGKLGVRTQLALVQDESSACWDLLANGHCHRGCACRWKHPSWQVSVDIVLELCSGR